MTKQTGRLTLPTDADIVEETIRLKNLLGADALRDCDGTEMPDALLNEPVKKYATYYTTRKDNAWAEQCAPLQVSGIAHLHDDIRRHGADTGQQALRENGLVAGDHDHRHGLANGSADAQDDACHNAGLRRRERCAVDAALMGRTQRQRALVVAVGNGTDRGFRDLDDGGQDHNAQQDAGGEDAFAYPENALHDGNENHQPKEAIHRKEPVSPNFVKRLSQIRIPRLRLSWYSSKGW